MRTLIALLLLTSAAFGQNPGPMESGLSTAPPCVEPTMTGIWVPASGSSSNPYATDPVAGNNAFQATTANQPTYGATCGPNSTPCLTFNGTSDFIQPTTPLPTASSDITMYAVIYVTAASQPNNMFGGGAAGVSYRVNSSNNVDFGSEGLSASTGTQVLSPNTWYTEIVTYSNSTNVTNFYFASAGSLIAAGSETLALGITATTTTLGGAPTEALFFTGKIAEWGYANSVTTAAIANWSSCHYHV